MLRAFLELLPDGTRAAFEFRHASWFDAEVFDALRARNIALCIADSEKLSTPVEITADYALLPAARRGLSAGRHRTLGRDDRARLQGVADVFVYFKHEEQGLGPDFARRFVEAVK